MILILGGSGYVGTAFVGELKRRELPFRMVTRKECDYTRFRALRMLLSEVKPQFVINCAGYTGKPNVDACEDHKAETLKGNALLPLIIGQACDVAGVPWGHVSSGCIYTGARVQQPDGQWKIEPDLMRPELLELVAEKSPRLSGFIETDPPNFSFRSPPCSFYSGTKALGEEAMEEFDQVYVWRLRIPFDGIDSGRNYLSKLQRYSRVYDNVNSVSHRGDFAAACLDTWLQRIPFGTYNVVNPGYVTSRQVVGWIQEICRPSRRFEFWENDAEFYQVAAKAPRSNCILDVSKLLGAGIRMRPVEDAMKDSLRNWRAEGVVAS